MKAYIQDISELSDSRELLESRPHPVIGIFTYTLIALIATAIIWSYLGEIDENIKAQGIVRPNQKISSIRSLVTGKVISVNLKEGSYVKKGDLLFTIEHSILDLQKGSMEAEYNKSTQELMNLEKFKKSVTNNRNYFSSTLDKERDYFNKFIKYQTDIEVQSKQVELNFSTLNDVDKELAGLNTLKQSVLQEKNLFAGNDSIYCNQYIDYSLNSKNLKDILRQKKDLYTSSMDLANAGAISSKELDDQKKLMEAAQIDLQKYQNEFLLNINSKIDENSEKHRQLQISLKVSGKGSDTTIGINESSLQKYKMDTIVQTETDINALQTSLEKQRSDLETANTNIENCSVTSPIGGYINISSEISAGDLLQSGTEVATIVPGDDMAYKVQLYVSNADIANIKLGQNIKYHFLALPYKEYGELTGRVTNIGTDARINQTDGSSFYSVEASVENKPLLSYKGVDAEIKVGMECEAQVISKTKKILYYLLEKINLRD
jgi:HlyD family type I secretion membrane fusion protein